ncbi:MAG: CDP-glycerol glycerophosphotransferase family protein [Candidatus Giovannonibacteria bacterium]|nr:MAG: CDP-glycerol glycerophosphotransferase family protein [Candidatus Giovannonibacteria bacterium]
MLELVREIKDFCRFFWRTPGVKRGIVFYAEDGGFYPYFEGLINELISNYKQDIYYITSGRGDPVLKSHPFKLKPFYLNKLLPIFMPLVKCGVFAATLNDLHRLHIKRSIYDVHYVYVPHTLVSTHMVFRFGALDYYDSILCAGPRHMEEIIKSEQLYGLKPKELVNAGYYRLERIFKKYHARGASADVRAGGKKTVLVAPSYGKNNVIESCGEKLAGMLLKSGYKVVVRPHPETTKRFPALINRLRERFFANPDFLIDESIESDEQTIRADVLVSDYSGISLEYAFGTERPVLFIDVPLRVNNPRYKELGLEPIEISLRGEIGLVLSPEKIDLAPDFVLKLIAEKEKYREKIIGLRQKYIYSFGRSSEIGAEHIMSHLFARRENDTL